MTHIPNRPRRVADLIQRTLAHMLLQEAKDPRFAGVTVTAVNVSPDLANATVYVTILDDSKTKESVAALNHAAGYLRHQLADEVELRIAPRLHFIYDESIRRADKINQLLHEAEQKKSDDR